MPQFWDNTNLTMGMRILTASDTGQYSHWVLPINFRQMKNLTAFILSSIFVLSGVSAFAQLERVYIEKYYVSDANDATDTTGGILPAGSTTYRVYVDMAYPGSVCKARPVVAHLSYV